MRIPDTPPRGLRWTASAAARGVSTLLAILALTAAVYLGIRQQLYVSCLADRQRADAIRTEAISDATDAERRADRELLAGVRPGGPSGRELLAAALAARIHTDQVRAANPPIEPSHC